MCPRLHAPIVLAHGLFGFDQIALGRLTLATYFRGIPEWLRSAGNRVLVTKVPPIAGIAARATRLGEQIAAAFPDEPVHLIGHSMGGLDSRLLLSDPDWSRRVLSLTTIGTPHLGSSIADFAQLKAGRIYRLLSRMGINHRGFLDVTRRNAREFHAAVVTPTGLPSFSIAGNPSAADVCWPLHRLHAALCELEGPNDGLVSVESALAFGTPLPEWPVDHLRQMNWLVSEAEARGTAVPVEYYQQAIANLAGLGFETQRRLEQEETTDTIANAETLPSTSPSTSSPIEPNLLPLHT
jgi:triacylglycerol lipase